MSTEQKDKTPRALVAMLRYAQRTIEMASRIAATSTDAVESDLAVTQRQQAEQTMSSVRGQLQAEKNR